MLFVFGHCKSAGTLVALGADEIVMSNRGELGPLDVQLTKDDEIARRNSGLDIFQALSIISSQAFIVFEQNFLQIIGRSGGAITTKTAAEIATTMASQLLAPISAQIDPIRLGEMQRAINIATDYGEKLGADAQTIHTLVTDYPSHTFVIDLEEAQRLFPAVRTPSEAELLLENVLRAHFLQQCEIDCVRKPHPTGLQLCLTPKQEETDRAHALRESDGGDAGDAQRAVEPAVEAPVRASRKNGSKAKEARAATTADEAVNEGAQEAEVPAHGD